VVTTALTFTATAEAARYLGADLKFVDVNPRTLNVDPRAVREAIGLQTKAIVPVHYAGLSCDMDSIFSIAKEYDLRVVEDATHALPSTWRGKTVGTLDSDATIFSFYAAKPMTTGEGGMIATRNEAAASRMRVLPQHGIDHDAFGRFSSNRPAWYCEVIAPGYKYNMPDLAAALGIQQLAKVK